MTEQQIYNQISRVDKQLTDVACNPERYTMQHLDALFRERDRLLLKLFETEQ